MKLKDTGRAPSIWIGFDPRQADAYAVARASIRRNLLAQSPIRGLVLADLIERGIYTRPMTRHGGQLFDEISQAPMSTEFACSRFLVPHLAGRGLALFVDSDVMARKNLDRLFRSIDLTKAVSVVKHNHQPANATKMDGQAQQSYSRKNWSSVCVFNCDHPSNRKLTVELINTVPGRDLHAFCWLRDDEIGELPLEWNWLAGHSNEAIDPAIVHFTDGVPSLPGYEACPYSDEWRDAFRRWAA